MQTTAASGHRRVALPELPGDGAERSDRARDSWSRISIPSIDGGRYPIKRIAGEPIEVWADLLREGHDQLAAELLWRKESESAWQREPMRLDGNDRWHGHFTPAEARPLPVRGRSLDRPVRDLAQGAAAQARRGPGYRARGPARAANFSAS